MNLGPSIPEYLSRDLTKFVGRQWVVSEVQGWLAHSTSNSFLIVGAPGSGKSLLSAHLAQTIPNVYSHFCRVNDGVSTPVQFVQRLSQCLAQKVPGYAEALARQRVPGLTIRGTAQATTVHDGARVVGVQVNIERVV